ncbi:sialic acid-binding Ig-like lectin 5 [Salminus brasiliensis]|uniref:sialic acid-binding Ig-like lectin 5 n=1 Tax=Salminus brasiliensis TaxID=930266 RepID=UPI003B837113
MRVPNATSVLLLMLALKVTCQEEKQNTSVSSSPPEWVTAVPGVCAVILCTYADSENQSFTKEKWDNCSDCQISSGSKDFGKRLSLLELDSSKKNCRMIINQIDGHDEGYYQFKLQTRSKNISCASVNITIQEKPLMSVPPLTIGKQTILSCSAPDPCPSARPNMTWWIKKQGQNITKLSAGNYSQNLSQSTITSELTFVPSLDQQDAEVVCVVSYGSNTTINMTSTLMVNSLMDVRISGANTVKEGDTLRLNCSAKINSPLLNITWSFRGASIQNNTTQGMLTITNFSSEHAGEYVCTVRNLKKTLTTSVNISVSYPPRILNASGCVRLNKYLRCKCNCKGVPLPHVIWQKHVLNSNHHHIEGYPNGSVIHNTLILHRLDLKALKCMCENSAGNDKKCLDIQEKSEAEAEDNNHIKLDIRTILTFFVGAASTVIIVCIALCFVGMCMRCRRVKAMDENTDRAGIKLETVKVQHDSAGADQTEEDEHTPLRRSPAVGFTAAVSCKNEEEETSGEDRPSGEEEMEDKKEQKEVDYACIDYSLLQGRGAKAQKAQSEETEYAEIQIKKQAEDEGPEPLQVEEVLELENQEQVEVEEAEV